MTFDIRRNEWTEWYDRDVLLPGELQSSVRQLVRDAMAVEGVAIGQREIKSPA